MSLLISTGKKTSNTPGSHHHMFVGVHISFSVEEMGHATIQKADAPQKENPHVTQGAEVRVLRPAFDHERYDEGRRPST